MRMKTFIKATEYGLWKVIQDGDYISTKVVDGRQVPKEESEFNEEDKRLILLNDKAVNILTCALSQKEYFRVSSLESAKAMWEALEIAHEGTSGVKENRVNTLKTEFELFKMNDGESIREMEVRFSHLINHLTALGQTYSQKDQVRKILGSLSKEWEPKVTAIEETKGESMTSVTALFGSLAEYESKIKYRHDLKEKKKGIALRVQDSDDDEDPDDEEIGLLVRKFKKFYKSRTTGRRFTPRKSTETRDPIICYECGKPGHIRTDCPQLSRKDKEKKKERFQKKKAFVSAI